MSTPKVSYNVVDKNTHDILVDAILDGGIGYTDKAGEVHQIDAKYGGGGSSLPEVSASDNGDVLTVVEGAWAKAAPSGGDGNLVITFNEETGVCNTTWQTIHDALAAGKMVIYSYLESNAVYQYLILAAISSVTGYDICTDVVGENVLASCNSANDYPVASE